MDVTGQLCVCAADFDCRITCCCNQAGVLDTPLSVTCTAVFGTLGGWGLGGGVHSVVVSLIQADFVFERKEGVDTIKGQAVSDSSTLQHGTFILSRNFGDQPATYAA